MPGQRAQLCFYLLDRGHKQNGFLKKKSRQTSCIGPDYKHQEQRTDM